MGLIQGKVHSFMSIIPFIHPCFTTLSSTLTYKPASTELRPLLSHTALAGKLFIHSLTEVVSHCAHSAALLVLHHVTRFSRPPTIPTLSHSILLYSVTVPHCTPHVTSSLVVSLSFSPSLPREGGDPEFENF